MTFHNYQLCVTLVIQRESGFVTNKHRDSQICWNLLLKQECVDRRNNAHDPTRISSCRHLHLGYRIPFILCQTHEYANSMNINSLWQDIKIILYMLHFSTAYSCIQIFCIFVQLIAVYIVF